MATDSSDPSSTQIAAGLFKLALALRHLSWQSSGSRGLTPTQSQILTLMTTLGPGTSVSKVAQHLAITKGTASESISTLERKKLLSKVPNPEDGRKVMLQLSRKGRREAQLSMQWPEVIVGSVEELPQEEQSGLLRGLIGLIMNMQEKGAIPTSRMCTECRFFQPNRYQGKDRPHHCKFLDSPIANVDLRIDCAEMEPAAADARPHLLEAFLTGMPMSQDS
ncbi:MAG: MarR family winged helix-turn-helix transcriptional regulator [Planctomycetota bacterium]